MWTSPVLARWRRTPDVDEQEDVEIDEDSQGEDEDVEELTCTRSPDNCAVTKDEPKASG